MLVERDRRDAVGHRLAARAIGAGSVARGRLRAASGAAAERAGREAPPESDSTQRRDMSVGGLLHGAGSSHAATPASGRATLRGTDVPRRGPPDDGLPAVLVAALAAPAAARAASFPPELPLPQRLDRPRVACTSTRAWSRWRAQAAALATEILERHEARYGVRRSAACSSCSSTSEDDPNGFATPLPYPLVHVRAVAPDGSDDFGNHDGWLRLVLTHELAHIVHLEQARGLLGVGRKLLRPRAVPVPERASPTWMIEGLATYEETEGTAFGRGRNPDSRMVLRMAALDGRFPQEDQAVSGLDRWPGGQAAYLFGEAFLRDLSARSGAETLPRLARATPARDPVPGSTS